VQGRLIQTMQIKIYNKSLGQIQHMWPFKCCHSQLYLPITTGSVFISKFRSENAWKYIYMHVHWYTLSQWCGIFHYYWRIASIKQRLRFPHAGLVLPDGFPFSQLFPLLNVIQSYCWHKNTNTKRYLAVTIS